MLTAPVKTYALSNLSLICRNGTEAVGRLTKSPYISTTSVLKPLHQDECDSSQPVERKLLVSSLNGNKKRSRGSSTGGVVRFSPETLDRIEQRTANNQPSRGGVHRAKKRRRFHPATDGPFWYSKGELRDIQKSCVHTIKSHALGCSVYNNTFEADTTPAFATATTAMDASGNSCLETLDRYYPSNQKRRRLARLQMYRTIKAVRQFEDSTNTKAPPELLASLLRRYSTQRVVEAKDKALRTADECALSSFC